MITFERANELLHYEPSRGKLFWKKRTARRIKVGDEAGTLCKSTGYRMVFINRKGYLVHRIAILLATGECDPGREVDHIDHDRGNNRLDNLRIVDRINNMRNIGLMKTNKTGVTGVIYDEKYAKYRTKIHIKGKGIYLGSYDTLEEAATARAEANKRYNFHPNHGL